MTKYECVKRLAKGIWQIRKSAWIDQVLDDLINGVKPYIYLLISAKIVDKLTADTQSQTVYGWIVLAVVVNAILILTLGWLDNRTAEHADACSMVEKNEITEKLLSVPYSVMEDGGLMEMVADVRSETSVRGGLYSDFLYTVQDVVTSACQIVGALVILFPFFKGLLSAPLQVAGLIVVTAICCGLFTLLKRWICKKARFYRDEYNDINVVYEEYRDQVAKYKTGKEIRIFHMQPLIMKEATHKILCEGSYLQKKVTRLNAFGEATGIMVFACITLGCYYLVGMQTMKGLFSVGDMLICIGALANLVEALRLIAGNFGELEDFRERSEVYYSVLDAPPGEETGKQEVKNGFHTITANHVTFTYPKAETPAVLDVSLTLHPGEKIAVVGENGSGKTTLIKLLCGLYKPQKGSVMMDGMNIAALQEEVYQKQFAVVFQDFALYSFGLGENVATSSDYDKEAVKSVLKEVGFTEKYDVDTVLFKDCDEDGVELSGGESQKVALARALFKRDASVVVLDEPTSAMDPFSEMELYKKFDRLVQGKSAIYISHRLSSCRFCDRILVMSDGKLVQQGTHDELVKDIAGKYYQLWNVQAKYWTV